MLDPIEEFLRHHQDEGRTESTGSFTISAEKAMQKLAAYQLPRTSAWLLKMVQAAVLAGCTAIDIQQSALSTTVIYRGGSLGSLDDLIAVFTDPSALVTSAQQPLLVGLRTVALSGRRPVLVTESPVDRPTRRALWNSGRVGAPQVMNSVRQVLGLRQQATLSFHVGDSPLTEERRFKREKGVKRVVADEYRELMKHAITCPIPLKVDARRIDHFGLEDASFHRCPILFGGLPGQKDEPTLRLSTAVLPAASEVTDYAAAWTTYLTQKPQASEVCWVKDGVICETTTLGGNSPFYLRLFLPADDLETDLSGLHLRFEDPAERRVRIAAGLKAFAESAPEIAAQTPLPFRSSLGHGRDGNWWGAAVLTVSGALLMPMTLGASALAALGILGMKVSSRHQQEAYEQALKTQFPLWAQALSNHFRV